MAIENGVQNAELGYILDPAFQIENINGKPAVGGHIEIFEAGTDNKYNSYQNFDGAQNPFKIPLGADGRAVILGDPSLSYDIYAYDSYNNLMFSRLNVQCNVPGTINLSGADTRINNTDGTLDISLRTLGNNVRQYTINTHNKVLDVQSPLYFVENSESATVIGFSGDDFASKEYVDSAISSKLDTTAFSNVSGDFLTDKFEYDDNSNITGYNGSAFAGGGSGPDYEAGDHIAITDNVISVTGLPDSADLENAISSAVTNVENKFEYNENNYITAYNNSAFAGKEYSAGDYVSIENNTISVTGLQPAGDYATKTELESATSGKMDVTGMTAYQPTGDYATHDDLTAYQPVGDYYSASNPSGFITNDAITGLQPSGDYATHDDLTAYATTALVSSVSSELYSAISGISGDYELVAGSGVELVDDPNEKTTTINVTAEITPVTAIEQMIDSATSGLQPSGDYATTAQVADKLDTTAFSDVSGSFLTAVPDTYLQNTDLATADGKVTAISGIPLSAGGGSVPTGTMNVTALEYDSNNKITAYDGSAFAGGSEIPTAVSGYWQSASDTVCANSGAWGGSALPVSAGPGVKIELVNDTLVFSNDETVLFETDSPSGVSAVTCSETVKNFEKIAVLPSRFVANLGGGTGPYQYYETKWLTTGADTVNTIEPMIFEYLYWKIAKYSANSDFTQFVWNGGFEVQQDTHTYTNLNTCNVGIKKIVGVKRIAGGN